MTASRKYAKGLAVREEFVEAAARLFAKRGFNASSIADITAATGLSKNQFFHHFGTKQALGLAVIEKAQRAWETDVIAPAVMFPEATDQLVAYHQKLANLTEQGWPYLKLHAMLSGEYGVLSAEMQQGIGHLNAAILDSLRMSIKGLKKAGVPLPAGTKARLMATTILALWMGASGLGSHGCGLVDEADLLEVTCQLFGLSLNSA